MFSGKSESIMRVLILLAGTRRFENGIDVVASTIPKLREDTMKIAEKIFHNNAIARSLLSKPFNKSERVYFFKTGTKLSFKSYENADEAEGAKRDVLYINEARRMNWQVAYLLIKRTNYKIFIDYNPVSRFWVHDELINCPSREVDGIYLKEFSSVKVLRSWHVHNPFLTAEKHNEIEGITDTELWKAYARGLTAQLSGLVYPNFDKLPANYIDDAKDVIWGIDLGHTQDPTVILKIAVNYKGYDYVFKSFGYASGIPAGDIAHIIKEAGYRFGEPVYMDHDKKSIRIELRRLRVVAIPALKGKGSAMAGIVHLRSKKLAICDEGQQGKDYGLEYELRRHSFLIDRNGEAMNEASHQFSHGPSAMRYGAYSHYVRKGGSIALDEAES